MSSSAYKKDPAEDRLAALRERIDQINDQLMGLLAERARLAVEIGELKRANGTDIYQPQREQQIIDGLLRRNPGPLGAEHIRRIFTEIISACRALEREVRVAFLGPEYSYTHLAAVGRFGSSANFVPAESIAAVFAAIDAGGAELGVVPVENSTEGPVTLTLDLLIDTPLQAVGELMLPVRHALLSASGERGAIRRIISHQQSLGQCRNYLAANFPNCKQEAVASNSLAAKMAAADPDAAAIASAQAAAPYGLRVIADGIQDVAQNITRFLVIGRETVARTGADKTTLIFAIPEKVGALKEVLTIFARNSINLSMIQSRPQRSRLWEYVFIVDLKGHRDDPPMHQALATLRRKALFLKVLGSYPEGRPPGD
ncbi:MAG TPA: prephenate dehydratase [Candidatus Binataceae bacterium]|nr:prephenate dehydratase [Candidatus Binataceae bacterium]